jgi:hypothetical protein
MLCLLHLLSLQDTASPADPRARPTRGHYSSKPLSKGQLQQSPHGSEPAAANGNLAAPTAGGPAGQPGAQHAQHAQQHGAGGAGGYPGYQAAPGHNQVAAEGAAAGLARAAVQPGAGGPMSPRPSAGLRLGGAAAAGGAPVESPAEKPQRAPLILDDRALAPTAGAKRAYESLGFSSEELYAGGAVNGDVQDFWLA